ncbi:hypothetical protein N9772_07315 [Bacteroidia bacterium]|nr:hypothetical protein [Bacteroidia bacterium]
MNFKNLQLILLINIFLLAIHSPAFCQNDNYSKVINGNRVNYSKDYSLKNYTVLDKNGFKTYSGGYTEIADDVLWQATFYTYRKEPFYGLKAGSIIDRFVFPAIDGKLNGLCNIGGYEWRGNQYGKGSFTWTDKSEYVAVVNNNVIGSSYENTDRRPDQKNNMEAKFCLDFNKCMQYGMEKQHFAATGQSIETYGDDLFFDLELMISIFLEDINSYINDFSRRLVVSSDLDNADYSTYISRLKIAQNGLLESNSVNSTFEKLQNGTIAVSYGIDDNNEIIIKVDPDTWMNANPQTRWYILYHELGHDVLNLRHGQGGRMMFNYPTKNYSWDEFFNDREKMFVYFLKKIYPNYDDLFLTY